MHLDRVLLSLERLIEQIEAMDDELQAIAEQDLICQRLMTVPGVQGAWSILRCNSGERMHAWAIQLAARRNRYVAVTALARKLTGILWALWTQGTTYSAEKAASSTTRCEDVVT